MNLKMVKSGLVLACVALATLHKRCVQFSKTKTNADWPTSSNTWHSTGQNIFPVKTC